MDYKLFLDDERYPADNSWVVARGYHDAVWYVTNYGIPRFISFDHDLAFEHYAAVPGIPSAIDDHLLLGNALLRPREFNGYDFAKWFCQHVADNDLELPSGFGYYVHSMNPVGAENIRKHMAKWMEDRE